MIVKVGVVLVEKHQNNIKSQFPIIKGDCVILVFFVLWISLSLCLLLAVLYENDPILFLTIVL